MAGLEISMKTSLALALVFCTVCVSGHSRKSFCTDWKFNVDVNNLQSWPVVPDACEDFVANYITGPQYKIDLEGTAEVAATYAKHVTVQNEKKLAWVFDIDETSLSNVPLFAEHLFGAEATNNSQFDVWAEKAQAPALPATLKLYNELKGMGFSLFFLTGRYEYQRNATVRNLLKVGYHGWTDLILRQKAEAEDTAVVYKSAKRRGIEEAGFHIVGNIGDQWSDLTGYSCGDRTFKLSNPMYYIS